MLEISEEFDDIKFKLIELKKNQKVLPKSEKTEFKPTPLLCIIN